ncbi:hypothetical protein Q31b_49560 [Novipirellula aureliae]|uniref:Uncharacterized protein n=1 Tax=Novipirellula aureliae TaxID=2527966 RepID=A0A5C6DKQ6_9BACT|nr:DUF6666 family protein [Novipirellula aureliae]TWU36674.1 hypothetical protein Q31b_49560 [Novipirellula aureliae]
MPFFIGKPALVAMLVLGMMSGANAADSSQVTWQAKRPAASQVRSEQITPKRSLVSQAATGEVITEMPSAQLVKGKRLVAPVQQTSFYHSACDCSGPVCDCGEITCGAEPVCGMESQYLVEPGCGAEPLCGAEYYEPACGAEVSCSTCGDYCGGACDSPCSVETIPLYLPLLRIEWCRFDFFAGVQGFKGPLSFANTDGTNGSSRSGSGSFGFYEGFNEGRSLKRWLGWDMAWQFGVRATQNNLSGAEFTTDSRNQVFLTTGFFRRVDYGLQYGLVFDYLNDDWYFQSDLTQLRGELSWKDNGCHVWGLQFAAGLGDDTSETSVINPAGVAVRSSMTFEPTDQYRLFYRRLLHNAGSWEAFAGWTDTDDGLLGASLDLPLRQNLSLATGATFLVPNEGNGSGGHQEESWNISLGLVYRPGGPMGAGRYSRPMFGVADNGTFLVDRL